MNQKHRYTVTALLLLIFFPLFSFLYPPIFALPFLWISKGLRILSLSGTGGNIVAIALYILLSVLPFLFCLKEKWTAENWLLPLTSAAILYCLYYVINPALRPIVLHGESGTLILCGSVWSLLFAWAIIRLLRRCDNADVSGIYQALRIFLTFCAIGCICLGLGIGFYNFLTEIKTVQESNTMPGLNLIPTYIFQFMIFATAAFEYILDALLLYHSIGLLRELEKDPYSENSYKAAKCTATRCKHALCIIVLSYAGLNLAQVLLAGILHNLRVQLRLPIFSIVLVFALLVLSHLLNTGKQLKEDNDLFI